MLFIRSDNTNAKFSMLDGHLRRVHLYVLYYYSKKIF